MKTFKQFQEEWTNKYKKSIDCSNPKGFSQRAHCAGKKKSMSEMNNPRISKKPGQPDKSDKHSDLYTDEDPKGTIQGLGFKDVATAKESVSKIKNSGRSHAHKIQAAIAMEQRAKVMGKSSESAIFRSFINSMKEKTKKINEESESKKCKPGYYYCNTNKECKPLPSGFNTPGQTIKPTEVGIGVPVEGSCNHTKKGKMCPKHGMKDCTLIGETLNSVTEEGLRDWFGKSKSKEGKPGWVNVVTGGTCASDKPGEGTPKCVSSAKRASMTPAERLSAARRKKAADPGQQQKSGAAKPTYVSTDSPKKKMKEEMEVQEAKDKPGKSSGKKDACYHKVKSRYSVWPSAYASGALVKCRKVGAANWGNKSEGFSPSQIKVLEELGLITLNEKGQKCWPGYEKKGSQTLFGKKYNRCVKKENITIEDADGNTFAEVVDVIKPDPIKGFKSQIEEATRLQSQTGNVVMVTLSWRGKYYALKIFFPQVKLPTRKEINDELQKVYPGSMIVHHAVSEIQPGQPLVQSIGPQGGNFASPGPSKKYVKPYGEQVEFNEDWQKVNRQDKTDGLSQSAVNAYRRENPGSKLQTAVTEKNPSGKRAKRRSSFCRRMKGMKSKLTSAETARDPDSRINKALRRWNCN